MKKVLAASQLHLLHFLHFLHMPSLGVYFTQEEADLVEVAAKAAGQKVAPYIAEAARRRMDSEGHRPGATAIDLAAEAAAAAEIVGVDRVLNALKGLKSEAYLTAAAAGGGE